VRGDSSKIGGVTSCSSRTAAKLNYWARSQDSCAIKPFTVDRPGVRCSAAPPCRQALCLDDSLVPRGVDIECMALIELPPVPY
jgi:hypothetical protein